MSERGEPWLSRWSRRAASFGALALAWGAATLALPLLVPALLLADLVTRAAWARTRAWAAVYVVLTCEGLGLAAAGLIWARGLVQTPERRQAANRGLQLRWVRTLFGALRFLYRIPLRVEGELGSSERPLIVLSRHTSLVDTLLPLLLLEGRALRYVLKRELLWDPCLDVVGQRLPNAFVQRGGDTSAELAKLRDLAQGLGPGEGVVIFPEGTRFTAAKRTKVLAGLERRGEHELLARAEGLRNLLPPRWAGAQALLEACPEADVLLVSHTGLEGAQTLASFWRGHLIERELRVHTERVPAEQVPRSPEGVQAFLWEAWRRMDAWVENEGEVVEPGACPRERRRRATARWAEGRSAPGRPGARSETRPAPPECAR